MTKFIAIATRTSGPDPSLHSIIEFSAVAFNPCPEMVVDGRVNEAGRKPYRFNRVVEPDRGEQLIVDVNHINGCHSLYQELFGHKPSILGKCSESKLMPAFRDWISKVPFVGKNDYFLVGHDIHTQLAFLNHTRAWRHIMVDFMDGGVLDLGSLFFELGDRTVPSLRECLFKIGNRSERSLRASEETMQVLTAVRRSYE